jgi:hypothetical protein
LIILDSFFYNLSDFLNFKQTNRTESETTSDTSPTTQTATQPSTKQRQPNKTTRLLELMITPHALPHPTITPYSNETAKASENNNGSGRYTSFVTKKTKKTTSGLKISESNEIYYNSI